MFKIFERDGHPVPILVSRSVFIGIMTEVQIKLLRLGWILGFRDVSSRELMKVWIDAKSPDEEVYVLAGDRRKVRGFVDLEGIGAKAVQVLLSLDKGSLGNENAGIYLT